MNHEAEFDVILKRKVEEALADPWPDIAGEEIEQFLRGLREGRGGYA